MYHPPSKRRLLIQRIIVYGLMTLSTVVLVTVLVFIMLGYQFNRSDGKIEQGGLVQFESRPLGASVVIDDVMLGNQTATKTTATGGKHVVEMQRSGYQNWQKTVTVVPGSILWLNYPRLVPHDRKVSHQAKFTTVSSTISSPDNKWMAVKEQPETAMIKVADITGDEVKLTDVELPETSYTKPSEGKTQSFQLVSWDTASEFMLVRHTYDDSKVEWLIVDRGTPKNTKNISTLLGIDPSKVLFSENNNRVLYVLVDGAIRRVDLGTATLSGPLVSNVTDFAMYESSILTYVTALNPVTKARTVGYLTVGVDKPRTIRSFTDDGSIPLHFRIDKYFDETYAVISYGENIEILKGDIPKSDDKNPSMLRTSESFAVPGGISYLSTMTNGRFIVAQTATAYTIYDLELKKLTTTEVKGSGSMTNELDWLDNYMLWSDRSGTLRFYEFDGDNQRDIMPVEPGFSVSLSQNGRYVYGFTKSSNEQFHLSRVRLILP
jgi:hypothetical protein